MWCQFLSIQLPNMLIIYAVLLLCNTFYSNLGFVMFYSTDFEHFLFQKKKKEKMFKMFKSVYFASNFSEFTSF